MEREEVFRLIQELNRLSNDLKFDTETLERFPDEYRLVQLKNVYDNIDLLVSYLELQKDKELISYIDINLDFTLDFYIMQYINYLPQYIFLYENKIAHYISKLRSDAMQLGLKIKIDYNKDELEELYKRYEEKGSNDEEKEGDFCEFLNDNNVSETEKYFRLKALSTSPEDKRAEELYYELKRAEDKEKALSIVNNPIEKRKNKYFRIAEEKGYIERTSTGYKNKFGSKALLAYFLERVFCRDDNGNDNGIDFPETALNTLFNESRLGKARGKLIDNRNGKPQGFKIVDELFE